MEDDKPQWPQYYAVVKVVFFFRHVTEHQSNCWELLSVELFLASYTGSNRKWSQAGFHRQGSASWNSHDVIWLSSKHMWQLQLQQLATNEAPERSIQMFLPRQHWLPLDARLGDHALLFLSEIPRESMISKCRGFLLLWSSAMAEGKICC